MSGIKALVTGRSRGEKKIKRARPVGFTSAGLSGAFDKETNTFAVTRSSALTQGLQGLTARLGERAAAFRGLRGSTSFQDLIRTRVDAIRAAGSRTVGNLREELGRRRVAGSSFAEREITSTEALFGREEERARAEGELAQLGVEATLIDQEFQASVEAAAVMVNQLNLESGIAAQLSESASQFNLIRAQLLAEIATVGEAGQIAWAAMERGFAHDFFVGSGSSGGGGGMFAGMGGGGGGASAGGASAGGAAAAGSDRRLKRNIRRIGTVNGYPWYSFDYIWGEASEGVMSDEIPQQFVSQFLGFDMVDYGHLLES